MGWERVDGLRMRKMQEREELTLTYYFPTITITDYTLKGGRGTPISPIRKQRLRITCRIPTSKWDNQAPLALVVFLILNIFRENVEQR